MTNGGGSKQALQKIKATCRRKYGVDNVFYLKEIQEKKRKSTLKHYGVNEIFASREIIEKSLNSKRKNNTFNTSKPEEELYQYIKLNFPEVKRQYKDERYPWRCDFYIPKLDCFIELNGHPSHGRHAYNQNSIEDQIIVKKWKQRYNNGEHPLYKRMIEGWTTRDVKKRETAKQNNLNYHEFWDLKDAKKFIDSL